MILLAPGEDFFIVVVVVVSFVEVAVVSFVGTEPVFFFAAEPVFFFPVEVVPFVGAGEVFLVTVVPLAAEVLLAVVKVFFVFEEEGSFIAAMGEVLFEAEGRFSAAVEVLSFKDKVLSVD